MLRLRAGIGARVQASVQRGSSLAAHPAPLSRRFASSPARLPLLSAAASAIRSSAAFTPLTQKGGKRHFSQQAGRETAAASASSSSDAAASSSSSSVPLSLPSQQQRWTHLQQLSTRWLQEEEGQEGAATPTAVEWVYLPNLREQAGVHPLLHGQFRSQVAADGEGREWMRHQDGGEAAAAAAAGAAPTPPPSSHPPSTPLADEAAFDPTLQSYLVSPQVLPDNLHTGPTLLSPHTRQLFHQLARWDRQQQTGQSAREGRGQVDVAADGSSSSSASSLPPLGWSSRGLFLDGPNGVGKSTSLYTLACLARAQGWFVVHMADADAWVGKLETASATRMLVQAIYEAAAHTVLPETASWSSPHSYLQLPLTPHLEYTSTLIDQGITSFGELLTLSLELEDGTEEAELSVECIMQQLMAITDVPVLLCVDGFDALTQRCLQAPDSEEMLAPIHTSPFMWFNFHRAQPFRGGFLLSGESFALVQQSQPEMMEPMLVGEEEEEATKAFTDATSPSSLFKPQRVAPLLVLPTPPLTHATLSKEYLLAKVRNEPKLASSFLLAPEMSATDWASIHAMTGGHFRLLDLLLTLPSLSHSQLPSPSDLRSQFSSLITARHLSTYESYFGDFLLPRFNLAVFFLRHLPAGFYRDFLRNQGRTDGGVRMLTHAHALSQTRDYNLIAATSLESVAMLEFIRRYIGSTPTLSAEAADRSLFVLGSPIWSHLIEELPWHVLTKDQLHMVQQSKMEAMLQVVAMGLMLQSAQGKKVKLTPRTRYHPTSAAAAHSSSTDFHINNVGHWCQSTDTALLHAGEMPASSLQLHWQVSSAILRAAEASRIRPLDHVTRLVHVQRAEGQSDGGELTLFLPLLDPQLFSLLTPLPTQPITSLMHTLYVHLLGEVLQAVQMCVGPACQVRAMAHDGDSYAWSDVSTLVDFLESGLLPDGELPLQRSCLTHLQVLPTEAPQEGAAPVAQPTVRVVFVGPHAPKTVEGESKATLRFHPLFDFADAIVGEEMAQLLEVPPQVLQHIQWNGKE